MPRRLSKSERQHRILERLKSQITVRILALAREFGVTTETIRRDIDELTGRGLVSRTYGGAASPSLTGEPGFLQRELARVPQRRRIAATAAALVSTGDVLMIDSGSTTAQFARALGERSFAVTVLTNSIAVGRALAPNDRAAVMLCPGAYRERELGVYGHEACDFLARFRADIAFIGAGGMTEKAITDQDLDASWIKRAMIARATRCVLLIDSAKFNAELFNTVCPLAEIDDVVTDTVPGAELAAALDAAGTRLHVTN